jgi:O-6-methylguanine DNA methyltransferase
MMLITITTTQDKIDKVALALNNEWKIQWIGHSLNLKREVETWLEMYLKGKKAPLPALNKENFTSPTGERVNYLLNEIEIGKTLSYSELAKKAGMDGAQRAVGTMIGKNPFALFLPCHRVIRSDGSIGGFAFGTAVKRVLLNHESKFTKN